MGKGRLEAFSDGVIAIVITIMVLEMKVPHSAEPEALRPVLPAFLSYVLSFVYVGILLEQSPPHLPRRPTGERHDALGQSSLAVLALVVVAFVNSWFACALYGMVAAFWFVPDRRVEREIETRKEA